MICLSATALSIYYCIISLVLSQPCASFRGKEAPRSARKQAALRRVRDTLVDPHSAHAVTAETSIVERRGSGQAAAKSMGSSAKKKRDKKKDFQVLNPEQVSFST